MKENELIVAIVERGYADDVMKAARSAGARGGTILHARGAGDEARDRFYGVTIQSEKEMVLLVVEKVHKAAIMKAICAQAGLNQEARGLVFSLPVEDAVGMAPEDSLPDLSQQ